MFWSTLVGKLERAAPLDPIAAKVTQVVNTVLPRGPVKDALHGVWLGHQLHPLLVAVPIGFWSGASLLDLTGDKGSRRAAQRLIGAGLLLVAPTSASGLADWSDLGAFHRPKRVGLVHAWANAATTGLYAASWWARRTGNHDLGRNLALLGSAGLAVGGYLGGHLAYSQGVGVNRNADVEKKPTEWTDAAATADVVDGRPQLVTVAGTPIVMVRSNGTVHAMGAVCSHYGGPLEQGVVSGSGEPCLVCPWHDSEFRLRDGGVARGPATTPQVSYDVRTVGDRLQIKVKL